MTGLTVKAGVIVGTEVGGLVGNEVLVGPEVGAYVGNDVLTGIEVGPVVGTVVGSRVGTADDPLTGAVVGI